MRILVAGSTGQVAQSLVLRARMSSHTVLAMGRPGFDLTDAETISARLDEFQPDAIINAAAYTAVDAAETDEEHAHAVNSAGAGSLAAEAARRSLPILHLSTDYVFDGTKAEAYDESDQVAPLGAYGRSKLAGERRVAAENPQHLILRTAWVFSPFGSNFVKTMLRLAATRDEVGVVADQIGSPSYAPHIADALLAMCDALTVPSTLDAGDWGLYNIAGACAASWADVAEEVFAVSRSIGGPVAIVKRITTQDYPTPAKRPANSRLDCAKLSSGWNISLPDWRQGVFDCVKRLVNDAEKAI